MNEYEEIVKVLKKIAGEYNSSKTEDSLRISQRSGNVPSAELKFSDIRTTVQNGVIFLIEFEDGRMMRWIGEYIEKR